MRIFVYGSLRTKQGNSHWMTNALLLGNFSIDNYQLYSPATIRAPFREMGQYTGKFIVLITPRWQSLTLCVPAAVNTHAS